MIESKIFDATLDSLQPIREFLTRIAASAGLDKKKTYNLCLAIDEIATNIINYGYPLAGRNDGQIEVTTETIDQALKITLIDSAVPFDPMKRIMPSEEDLNKPLEERAIGGLGVMIAKQSVDEFLYEYSDQKNRNIFIVRF